MRARRAHLLALAAVASAILITGCGASSELSVSQLVEREQALSGEKVQTHGLIRLRHARTGGAYLVLEGESGEEVGLKPAREAKRYLGQKVIVTGRLQATPFVGRVIELGHIHRG